MSLQDTELKKQNLVYYVSGDRQTSFDEYDGSGTHYYTVGKLKTRTENLKSAVSALQTKQAKMLGVPRTFAFAENCSLEVFFKNNFGSKLETEFCSVDEGATLAAAKQLRSILYHLEEKDKQANVAYIALRGGTIVPSSAFTRDGLEKLEEKASQIETDIRDRKANKKSNDFELAYATYQASPKYTLEEYAAVERSDADESYKVAAFATLVNECKKLAVLSKAIESTPENYLERRSQEMPELEHHRKLAGAASSSLASFKGLSCYGRCTSDYVYRNSEIRVMLSECDRQERGLRAELSKIRSELRLVEEEPLAVVQEYRDDLQRFLKKRRRYLTDEKRNGYEKLLKMSDGELRVLLTNHYKSEKAEYKGALERNEQKKLFFMRAAGFLTPEKIATLKDIVAEPVDYKRTGSSEELTELSKHVISGELTFSSEVAKCLFIRNAFKNTAPTEKSVTRLLEQCPVASLSRNELHDLSCALESTSEQLQKFAAEKIAVALSKISKQQAHIFYEVRSGFVEACSDFLKEHLDSTLCEYGKAAMLLGSSNLSDDCREKVQFFAEVDPILELMSGARSSELRKQLASECWRNPLIKASLESRLVKTPEELLKLCEQIGLQSTPTVASKRAMRF